MSDSINSAPRRSILKSTNPTTDNTHEKKNQSDKNSRLVKLSLAALGHFGKHPIRLT
jgi:hypothetical protein